MSSSYGFKSEYYSFSTRSFFTKFVFQSIVVCLLSSQVSANQYECVWYGQSSYNGKSVNFPYNGTAKELNDGESIQILRKWCPNLAVGKGPPKLCCDSAQLNTLDMSVKLVANFIKRCPSCLNNLLAHICELTCSPHQSQFVKVTDIAMDDEGKPVITGVEIYLSENYMSGTYNSCKGVSMPASSQLVMDIMCGQWGGFHCTYQRWFEFMGNPIVNGYVPFKVAYKPVISNKELTDGFESLDPNITACNNPVNFQPACSCVDCEASCPAAPPPRPPVQPCRFLGVPCIYVVMAAVFVFGSVAFLLVVNFEDKLKVLITDSGLVQQTSAESSRNVIGRRLADKKHSSTTVDDDETSPLQSKRSSLTSEAETDHVDMPISTNSAASNPVSYCEKLGAELDKLLQESFERLGRTCALRPWRTLLIGLCVVIVLGQGILYLHLTTDPVELWASPSSRCRQEKTYFDTHFEPFYRTEQIIIHPVGLQNVSS